MELEVQGQRCYAYTGNRAHVPGQPAICFVHGAGQDHTVWLLQTRWFAYHGWNVLALDLPGHGRSGGAPLPSVPALADWVAAALTAADVEPAVCAGHSLGSLVALDLAARHPERVRALALLGTAAPMPVGEPLLEAARENRHEAFDMINIWAHGPEAIMGPSPVPGISMLGNALRLLEASAEGVLFADLNACNEYQDGLARAAEVRCPVLMLVGDSDRMTPPKAARELGSALAGVQVRILPRCGHMLMTERAGPVLDALRDFCLGQDF